MFFVDDNQKAIFVLPYSFPLVVHETYLKDKPMGFNSWHWHEEIQLSLVVSGQMITTAHGRDYLLRAGEGFFINSNLSHMTRPVDEDSARYLSLNIKPSLLTLFHGSVVEQKYYLPYLNNPFFQMVHLSPSVNWQRVVLRDLHSLFRQIQKKRFGYELEAYSYLLHIWNDLLRHIDSEPEERPFLENSEAHKILSFLKTHYAEDISLDRIASHVHLSKSECCNLFRANYNSTMVTFLTNYRLQKSISLLTETDDSVSDIAEKVGFRSTSYYIKCFREKTGSTPLKYRNAHST